MVMGRPADVSVIIAVHNGMPYLEQALGSVLRQTLGLRRMQVLVVDDGSTDGTSEYLAQVAAQQRRVEVMSQTNSGGPAAPRNRALREATGRYVFFLDADDTLSDDALATMVGVADANGTDVVAGRIKGVGGRRTPRRVFARTAQRTDVFRSPIYGSLNPMKLFRTELVHRLGLGFPTGMPWGEDQPFVASAYLDGSGISVLADKDYVFWGYREDRSNITTRAVALADRMPVADAMFDLVASKTDAGPERDRLMRRHFWSEFVGSAFEGYRNEADDVARRAAFARFVEITDAHYTERIDASLPPDARVLMRLVSERRSEEFSDYLDLVAAACPPAAVARDGLLMLAVPWMGDGTRNLPDDLFNVETQVRAWCRAEPLQITGSGFHIVAGCGLGPISHLIDRVSLVLRSAQGEDEVIVPLAHTVVVEEGQSIALVDDDVSGAGLIGVLEVGTYSLHLRVSAGATSRDRRIAECAPPLARPRIVHASGPAGGARSGLLVTTKKGNLSLRVVDGRLTERVHMMRQRRDRIVRGAKRAVKRLIGR